MPQKRRFHILRRWSGEKVSPRDTNTPPLASYNSMTSPVVTFRHVLAGQVRLKR